MEEEGRGRRVIMINEPREKGHERLREECRNPGGTGGQ